MIDILPFIVILTAGFIWSLYYRTQEKLGHIPLAVKLIYHLGLVIPFLYVIQGNIELGVLSTLTSTGWGYLIILALVSTLGAYGFAYLSNKKVGSTTTATLDLIDPMVSVLLAIIIFGESATPIQLIGWGMIFFSIFNIGKIRKNEKV